MAIKTKKELEDMAISFVTIDRKQRKIFGTEEYLTNLDAHAKEVIRQLKDNYDYQIQLEFC